MRMLRFSFINFRNGFKSYLSLVLSLSFSILVLYNFQNIIYSEAFAVLGQRNKQYIDMLIQTVSVVLVCFLFFCDERLPDKTQAGDWHLYFHGHVEPQNRQPLHD